MHEQNQPLKENGIASQHLPQTARQGTSQSHPQGALKLQQVKSDPNLWAIINKIPVSSSKKQMESP